MRVFVGPSPIKPVNRLVVFPPNCIDVCNVVTQTILDITVIGADLIRALPCFSCSGKNFKAIQICSENPHGTASIYERGMIMVTGCDSARASRYTAHLYLDLIRKHGYPNARVVDFKIVNITTAFALSGALDIRKYQIEVCPTVRYLPDVFAAARKRTRRTNCLLSMFIENCTLLGSPDLRNMVNDAADELDLMQDCLAPFGSIEERDIKARYDARKRQDFTTIDEDDRKRKRQDESDDDDRKRRREDDSDTVTEYEDDDRRSVD